MAGHPTTSFTPTLDESDKMRKMRRRTELEILRQQLWNERSTFITHWRDLADHIRPRRLRTHVTDVNKGDRRNRKIIDNTATLASRTLSAGMSGGLTSPAQKWFTLTIPDKDLAEVESVQLWLEEVTDLMLAMFGRSNIYQALPVLYGDMGDFATGAVFIEEDFETTLNAISQPIGSYMLATDERGRVNTYFRDFRMTVLQLVQKFAEFNDKGEVINWEDTFSSHVKTLWFNKHFNTYINVCHAVTPNPMFDPNKLESRFKKFSSVYFERGADASSPSSGPRSTEVTRDRFLREAGYDHFPVLAGRWEVAGEDVYGTSCPGMDSLGDNRQLQLGEKRGMQAVEKMVNPPMKGPTSLRTAKASILPGDLTFTDEREGQQGFRPVHEIDPRIRELEFKQDQVRARIKEAYFKDLFRQFIDTTRREITATEVAEKQSEKLQILGSVLSRLNMDVLDPLIDIGFEFMLRQGQVPEPPPELEGRPLRVEYVSVMAQAQKLSQLESVERFSQFVLGLSESNPDILDKINFDILVTTYAQIIGVPRTILQSEEVVAAVRQARQQAAQAQQTAQAIEQGAGAVKDLSKATLTDDSALKRLLQQTQGGAGAVPEEIVA